jgi:glycosyltransferase involved in cell wall biosynthesis
MKTKSIMTGLVNLSIILTTHTEKVHFESLLLTLSRLARTDIELIIINDNAGPEFSDAIQYTLSKTDSDHIYYFEHDKKKGRGNCLNEGLSQAIGTFVWAPLKAQRLNDSLLTDSIRRFKSDPAAFWSLDFSLPRDPMEWIEAASEGYLPDDSCLVWNQQVIEPKNFFFNPFLDQLHGAELALRLYGENVWHKTDPFFVLDENQSPLANQKDLNELYHSLLRLKISPEEREQIQSRMFDQPTDTDQQNRDDLLLLQARQLLNQGDANKSLELISRFLKKHPDHHEGSRIKITSLEKLRRHVEAAELKHHLQKMESLPKEQPEPYMGESQSQGNLANPANIKLSVVIPTTAAGKILLESALLYLDDAVDTNTAELIVIDNASIDDTFEYLEQLQEKNFLNLKVITNKLNKGFGASVNQGIDRAKGDYILVMHNDLYLNKDTVSNLLTAFEEIEDLAIAAPVLNETDIPGQKKADGENARFIPLKSADSACFLLSKNCNIRFDEEYNLCHFEMADFCNQIIEQGKSIVAVPKAECRHEGGKSTEMMGMKLIPKLKWQNRSRYHKKWAESNDYLIPKQGSHPDRFIKLGVPDDPLNPEIEWVNAVQNYLTDEVKTEILRTKWDEPDLTCIVTSLLIADERELLRTLEDRLDFMELPPSLLILFVEYYFNKNIYSRCRHYLEKAGNSHPIFDLYRLKIVVADKELDTASPLLTKLLNKYPASPDLLQLAGDIYRHSGDDGEAKSFYALARRLDPFRFSTENVEFEISSE